MRVPYNLIIKIYIYCYIYCFFLTISSAPLRKLAIGHLYEAPKIKGRVPMAQLGSFNRAIRCELRVASCAVGGHPRLVGWSQWLAGRRKRAFNRLAIDRISAMSKEELSKVDRELEGIVVDLPRLRTMIR